MRIAHIVPHLGGGVGRVLLAWISRAHAHTNEQHVVVCLEHVGEETMARARMLGISVVDNQYGALSALNEVVHNADITTVHWWNHPLLYDTIVNGELPPCRMAIWSHVAGHTPPHVFTKNLITYPDFFVVATPYSLEAPIVAAMNARQRTEKLRLVFTCAGIDHVADAKPLAHEGFVVGYIGTVDYCKLHRQFLSMCAVVDQPDIRFVVVGGPNHEEIRRESSAMGLDDKITFAGQVAGIVPYLSSFDIFGYPLAPGHYGTGEQALIEAMAAGLPTVVFSHGAERCLVDHERTGLIVNSEGAYAQAIMRLRDDAGLRTFLGKNAAQEARERFSLDTLVDGWHNIFLELSPKEKRLHTWAGQRGIRGAQLYVESLGESIGCFRQSLCPDIFENQKHADRAIAKLQGPFCSETRGSPFHYHRYFPNDHLLAHWCSILRTAPCTQHPSRKSI